MNSLLPPIGVIHSIKEWATAKDGALSTGVAIKEIYPETPILSKTRHRPPWPSSWFPNQLKSQGGYVAVLPHGRVWGLNGAIITPDNQLLWDASFEGVDITPENHSIFKEKTLPAVSFVKNAADLTHVFSRNYYHWMYEVLPRIHLIQQSGLAVNQYIVNTEPEQPYQTETLNQIGLNHGQLLRTHVGFHVQADHLIISTQPTFPTKWGHDFLRKTFLKGAAFHASDKKRIYISRKWSRKITNEDQVMDILRKYDFVKVELESLSVAEQVQLFSSAEAIVGVHGAALTNLTFCSPGTKILEIFLPNYVIAHFYGISALGNLKYYYFIGEKGEQIQSRWPGADDVTLNIPKFAACLKRMRL
ncbi:glycosyltransferase family 61 protein [Sporolactobacillus shoreae]|uniref:Glycosyltransferase family 61 protein n=1 Tax=Sporolactobacillus shoreae TaxID=1465501 RepID=A0A4Z0GQQ4_9BACL|nr:glycosyltransferase family 61 protein [Sporolactobacillus shoreae]TGA98713.1 glycosyltransferase family 61 protein [Sporolactobacillus shoreae]